MSWTVLSPSELSCARKAAQLYRDSPRGTTKPQLAERLTAWCKSHHGEHWLTRREADFLIETIDSYEDIRETT